MPPKGRPRIVVTDASYDTRTRVGAVGPRNARIMIVGMAPAREEVRDKVPFVGPSGRVLNNALRAVGIDRGQCYITNLVHYPIPNETSVRTVPPALLNPELERLHNEILAVKPNVIVPMGADPLHFICGKSSMQNWRGSILPSVLGPITKCVPTVHPAFIIRGMWKWNSVFTFIDMRRVKDESSTTQIIYPTRRAITGPSLYTVVDYLERLNNSEYVAFDIETRYWRRDRMGEIACVAFADSPSEGLCIPFIRANGRSYWTEPEEARIWQEVAKLLQNRRVKKIAQNAGFEWIYFWKHGIFPYPLGIDTMTLHHCLYPDWGSAEDYYRKKKFDEPGHGLAFINSQYTKTPYYKDDGKFWSPELGEAQFWNYNAMDAMVTFDVAMQMKQEALEERQWDFYNIQYLRPFLSTVRNEWFGYDIDEEMRDEAGLHMHAQAEALQEEIDEAVGYAINVNSPKQMMELLYKKLGYQIKRKLHSSKPTADKDTLRYFAQTKQNPILLKIMELRRLRDTISDIIEQPLLNGKLHTHYKIGGTDGLRWSSSRSILGNGTNLQNIPRDGIARKLFTANAKGSR